MLKRLLTEKLLNHLPKKQYTIIVGARQTGKTTLLKHLYETSKNKNEICYYLTFENYQILEAINENPENIFHFAEKVFVNQPDSRLVLFIDEIQYARNTSNFLKYLYDTYNEKLKIVATGSSAFYIDKNFNDSLAGRKRIFHLKHLNFEEYLFFQNAEELHHELLLIRNSNDYLSVKRNDILYFFEEYLRFGGYPAVAIEKNSDEKIEILRDLKNSYLKKDIYEAAILYQHKFMQLILILAEQIGNLININELSNTLGIDNKTIGNYLYILQKTFHINLIKPYFNNMRKEITKMPKLFFSDLGFRNSLLNNFEKNSLRQDKGELLENYVFIRLSEIYDQDSIQYWRTADQNEVDFIVKKSNVETFAFEVKYSENLIKPNKYRLFKELYPRISLDFLSLEKTTTSSKNILNL